MEEHLFSAEVDEGNTRSAGKSRWHSCLTGCLVVVVVLAVRAILVGFWVSRNWRQWVSMVAVHSIQQGIDSSQLPDAEKQEIMVQVDRVAAAFREQRMSGEQLRVLVEKLVNSPLMSSIVASTIERHYFAKSGLSEQEQAEGSQTLQRFIRGAIDEKINEAGFDAAMVHVADRDAAQGQWKVREKLTDDQLRAFLAEAKQQADAAGIPEQPAGIDPSAEIEKIVDEATKVAA